ETAEYVDLLGRVHDADKGLAGFGDDLFAGQCRATALDQPALRVALVRAVDVERQRPRGIEVEDVDPHGTQAFGALLRARHRTGDAVADACERLDEVGDGGTGTDPDDAAVGDVLDGLLGGQPLGFGHG